MVVAFVLAHGAAVNERDEGGYTAVHWAVSSGKRAVLSLLLSRAHAEPNVPGRDDGQMPLHLAVLRSDAAAVRLLMRHGADPRSANAVGLTAIDLAAKRMLFDIYPLLAEPQAARTTSKRVNESPGSAISKRTRAADENQSRAANAL